MSLLDKLRTLAKPADSTKKRFMIHISMPILVIGIVIVTLTLGWSFFMGFLVGRGADPGTRLNSLPIFGGGKVVAEQGAKAKPAVLTEAKEKVEAATPEPSSKDKDVEPKEDVSKPVHPFTRPQGQSVAAWGNQPQVKDEPAKEAPKNTPKEQVKEPEPKKKADSKEPRYEVRYQVASFSREVDAVNMSKQCRAKGLNASPQLFGKVYRVVISFRGTVTEANAMKAKARGLGIQKWIIITTKNLDAPKNAPKSDKRQGR